MLTSISDYPGYTDFCRRAAEDAACFATFREAPVYSAVVSSSLHSEGRDYFDLLQQRGFDPGFFDRIRDHDRVGGPKLVDYGAAGLLAPQTMRYVKVLSDLEQLYGSLDGASVIEIGCGFGGQCAVVAKRFKLGRYLMVDLDEPLMLARRYLDTLGIENAATARFDQLPFVGKYDLVISCYGLSELARRFQILYMQRVLLRATAGYLLWNNEGMREHRDWQLKYFGEETIYADELLPLLPDARLAEPSWLAADDQGLNARLILWGTR